MRRLKRGVPVGLFLLVTFFYPLLAPTAHRIDEAHFEQISLGMTLEEVESRFGAPAGSYDWAVPKDPIGFFPPALALIVRAPSRVHTSIVSQVILNRELYAKNVVSFTVMHRSMISRTWTSRHGSCTIHFDQQDRVVGKSGWGESRLEPPWHNWRKWFSK